MPARSAYEAAAVTWPRSCRVLAAAVALAAATAGCGGRSEVDAGMSGEVSTEQAAAAGDVAPMAPRTTSTTSTTTTPATTSTRPEAPPTTTSVPSDSSPDGGPAEAEGIGREDLQNLTVQIDGDTVEFEGGQASVTHGGASADTYTLQDPVARGDLDGDGDEDMVAHIVGRTAGTGVFHYIVPVINDEGTAVAQPPAWVGDRIVLDSISVGDGLIEVSLFDRAPDEPFTVITTHTVLEIDVSAGEPRVTVIGTQPIEDMPPPGPERPVIDVRFDPGAVSVAQSGSIDFRERQTYTVQASEDQPFTAILDAPPGLWLDVRLDDLAVTSASQRSQLVETDLPATGLWHVTVISSQAGQVDYELTVEVLPVVEASPATTTTAPIVPPPRPVTPDDDGAVVYLTFDDGPHAEYTPQLLDVLARHGVRATFFVVGRLAQAYPDIIQRIAAEGHTLANHTWRHEDLAGLSREAFDETVGRTQTILADLATPCLRPPYGSVGPSTRDWAAAHGLALVMWDSSPQDWLRPPAEEIADHIVQWARPGVVLLLHDGGGDRSRTVQGVDMALERLADRGLRYEPVCR